MELAMIGLGRMGGNMTRRLARGGHRVVAHSLEPEEARSLARELSCVEAADTLADLHRMLTPPRITWVMVPAGEQTDRVVDDLMEILEPGDVIIDGGNSNFRDTVTRAARVADGGLQFLDVGTSGGIGGLMEGYSLTVGGSAATVDLVRPIMETLAPGATLGWGHVGPHGAGHFVKMVHNGVEYGMMQALAEGFEILHAKREFDFDIHQVAEIWRHGSVIRSWLLDLAARALHADPTLAQITGWVDDSGEGRWTVLEALDMDIPAPVITLSLMMRFVSRRDDSFGARLLASLRNQFGGHPLKTAGAEPHDTLRP